MSHASVLAAITSRESKVAYARKHLLRVSVRPRADGKQFHFRILSPQGDALDAFDCSRANYARISKAGKAVATAAAIPNFRWRLYETASGGKPVLDFIETLTPEERSRLRVAMHMVKLKGLAAATRMNENRDLYEIRVDTHTKSLRVLFASEGKRDHILLGLHGFEKKRNTTPRSAIDTAMLRLADWRSRAKVPTR